MDAAIGYDASVTPSPPARPLGPIAFLRQVRKNELGVFGRAVFENDITEAGYLFQRFAVLNYPEAVKHVLLTNHANYVKGRLTRRILGPLLGEGLLTSEGETWRRQRRQAAPAFNHGSLAGLALVMAEAAAATIERWRPTPARGAGLDIAREMMALTMEIVGKALFSRDLGDQADALGQALTTVIETIGKPHPFDLLGLPEWLPRRRDPASLRAIAVIQREIGAIIADRRAAAGTACEEHDDILAMLLAAPDDQTGLGQDRGFRDSELRDQILTLFAAGHETTAVALTWTWYLLSQHPAIEHRLHAELDEVLGGRLPRFKDLEALRYTRMVLEEAMRLFPPAYAFNRVARADDEVPLEAGDHRRLRAGTFVTISPYVLHRKPTLWPDPLRFDPERFAPEQVRGRHRYAYLPFGGGLRICIGNGFAMMEGCLILAAIAQAFRLRLAPGHRVEAVGHVTLRPRGGMRMLLEARGQP